jgi:NAD(P)-dependent dehydrogenase (short-subunit alcohol dehydrogenase family)
MATVLVTGAGRGIGLELTKQLKARGDQVIAVCRTVSPELERLGVRVESGIELTSEKCVDDLKARMRGVKLDALILNAGVLKSDNFTSIALGDIRQQLEVNALAPLALTQALSENLARGAKVALITSRMGSLGDNTSGGYYGYRMSKAALNMAGVSLAHDLKPRGIAVAILHPGYVRTDMTGGSGQIGPDESARLLLARIDALNLDTSGHFWHANGESLPW